MKRSNTLAMINKGRSEIQRNTRIIIEHMITICDYIVEIGHVLPNNGSMGTVGRNYTLFYSWYETTFIRMVLRGYEYPICAKPNVYITYPVHPVSMLRNNSRVAVRSRYFVVKRYW